MGITMGWCGMPRWHSVIHLRKPAGSYGSSYGVQPNSTITAGPGKVLIPLLPLWGN